MTHVYGFKKGRGLRIMDKDGATPAPVTTLDHVPVSPATAGKGAKTTVVQAGAKCKLCGKLFKKKSPMGKNHFTAMHKDLDPNTWEDYIVPA